MARTTRILGHMVTHNELGRYLPATLDWLVDICDTVVAYDDGSTDGTVDFLRASPVHLGCRPADAPSFSRDESALRAAAWKHLERVAQPQSTDWVLCIDADEFLVADDPASDLNEEITDAVEEASRAGAQSISFEVAEVFDTSGPQPMVRTDGYWGEISACRLVRWRDKGRFDPRREGGGSVPSSWISWRHMATRLHLLHLGYATPEDRKARFMRYSAGAGHNPRHITSILQPPSLVPWTGMTPDRLR
jgi:glycosyltransferase involved in cell wall biosynthesis